MEQNTQIILILCLITYILNLVKYFKNPINYSNKEIYFTSYHNVLFALEMIILICLTMFFKSILELYVPIRPKYMYIALVLTFLIILTYKRKPIVDDSKFFLPPETISKGLKPILIINIICILGLIYMTQDYYLYPIVIINIYLFVLNYNFSACKFNLPNTFNK